MSADLPVNRPVGVADAPVAAPAVAVDVAAPLRDRVRWGPVVAGVVTGFVALLVLTALGISTLGGMLGHNQNVGHRREVIARR